MNCRRGLREGQSRQHPAARPGGCDIHIPHFRAASIRGRDSLANQRDQRQVRSFNSVSFIATANGHEARSRPPARSPSISDATDFALASSAWNGLCIDAHSGLIHEATAARSRESGHHTFVDSSVARYTNSGWRRPARVRPIQAGHLLRECFPVIFPIGSPACRSRAGQIDMVCLKHLPIAASCLQRSGGPRGREFNAS